MCTPIDTATNATKFLPKPVVNEFACKFCPYQYPCFLEHTAIERGVVYTENPAAQFLETTGFREDELVYFRRWHSALLHEQVVKRRRQPKFWKKRGERGQKPLGRLISVEKDEVYRMKVEMTKFWKYIWR